MISAASFAASREPVEHGLRGASVLVVDDHEDSRDLVAMVLAAAGALVSQASSAAEALTELESKQFALLVSDIGMPESDGYELLRRIRRAPATSSHDLPAIALTAFCTANDRRLALSAGFQEHMGKPFEPHALIEAAERLIRRH